MKTVVPAAQVAHLWANESQESARVSGGNFYFSGATIFSYRDSYAVATLAPWRDASGRRIVVMRDTQYSPTTGRHMGYVRGALRGHPVNVIALDPCHYPSMRDIAPNAERAASLHYGDYGASQGRAIARGDAGMARGIIGAAVLQAIIAARAALDKMSDGTIAHQYGVAADRIATARLIAAASAASLSGKDKRDHVKACAAILSEAPELPAGFAERADALAALGAYPGWNSPQRSAYDAAHTAAYALASDSAARTLWTRQRAERRERDAAAQLGGAVADARRSERDARAVGITARTKRAHLENAARAWRKAESIAKRQKKPAADRKAYAANASACDKRAAQLFNAATLEQARHNLESMRGNVATLARRMAGKHRGRVTLSTGKTWNRSDNIPSAWRDAKEPAYKMSNMGATVAAVAMAAGAPRGERAESAQRAMQALTDRGMITWRDAAQTVADLARIADGRGETARAAHALMLDLSRAADVTQRAADAALRKIEGRYSAERAREFVRVVSPYLAGVTVADAARAAFVLARELPEWTPDAWPRGDVAAKIMRLDMAAVRAALARAQSFAAVSPAAESLENAAALRREALGAVQAARELQAGGLYLDAEKRAERAHKASADADRALSGATLRIAAAMGDAESLPAEVSAEWEALAERAAAMRADVSVSDAVASALRDMKQTADAARADIIAHWRNTGDGLHALPAGAYFRRDRDGDIVSNLGARVSETAGRRLWALIRATVAAGKSREWPWGAGPRVGSFHVVRIGSDGSAVVGCHNINAKEARAFAEFMCWPPFGAELEVDNVAA